MRKKKLNMFIPPLLRYALKIFIFEELIVHTSRLSSFKILMSIGFCVTEPQVKTANLYDTFIHK